MEYFKHVFLHKKDIRKILLFSSFKNASNKGIHVNELDMSNPHSRKTLYSDIRELEQDLICVCKSPLLKEENNVFRLVSKKKIQSQNLIHYYIKNSREFRVFQTIMNNNGISIYKISEVSYYSKSSIYNSIEKLNKNLKPLGISCRTSGLIGDEKKIRHFVFESYWTLFGGIEWPFKVKREEILSEIKSLEMNGKL